MMSAIATDWSDFGDVRAKIRAGESKFQTARSVENGVVLTCAATLKPQPVSWLWRDWLALGKFHVLAGAPGQGKTTLTMSFAATVTSSGCWPDGSRCAPGNVLMWSGEDDPADTLLPRLLAMGAEPSRVHFVTGARIANELHAFDPARDMPQLLIQAERIGNVRLLIVDPVVSAVAGDSHKNTEVRRALQPLVDLGAALGAAVLGVSHFSKGSAGRDPTERVVGSMAFGAVARVVMCAAKLNSSFGEGDRRVLVRSKSNIGPDDGGFEYGIVQTELDGFPGIQASLVEWGQGVEGTARELLAEADTPYTQSDDNDRDSSAFDAASEFLRGQLEHGPKTANEILTKAQATGHRERTIKRAKAKLGIESLKESGGWMWCLPAKIASIPIKDAKCANSCASENLGSLGTLGDAA